MKVEAKCLACGGTWKVDDVQPDGWLSCPYCLNDARLRQQRAVQTSEVVYQQLEDRESERWL